MIYRKTYRQTRKHFKNYLNGSQLYILSKLFLHILRTVLIFMRLFLFITVNFIVYIITRMVNEKLSIVYNVTQVKNAREKRDELSVFNAKYVYTHVHL